MITLSDLQTHKLLVRKEIAFKYLDGMGIEVGALHSPLSVKPDTIVRYVDRFDVKTLREHYPELNSDPLVNIDIIDDGEVLSKFSPNSQDFVIANHFLEHSENTILTIENLLRVVRKGGFLYLAIPNKEETFDINRPSTSIEHLLDEYENGSDKNTRLHYEEFVRIALDKKGKEFQDTLEKLLDQKYSIHFHVWNSSEIIDFIVYLKNNLYFEFSIEEIGECYDEVIFILKKINTISDIRKRKLEDKAMDAFEKKSPAAKNTYNHLLMYEPNNSFYLYQIALISINEKAFETAIDILSACIEIDSKNKLFYEKLSYCLRELEEFDEAEEVDEIANSFN